MILVAGGTGRLGSRLVSRLAARGLDVAVLTRQAERAGHLRDIAEVVVGDVRNRDSLDAAMSGVVILVSAVQGFAGPGRVTPATVDRNGNINLIDAAEAVGADMVMASVVGASAASPMDLFRAKYDAEQYLRASAVEWTIVRATAFVELWAEIMGKHLVFGRGANPINFVSVHDVVATVEQAVVDPSHRGQILQVGGPQDITCNDLMAMLQDIRGDRAKVRHIPRWALHALAPVGRQARAALAMDTVDMTFEGLSGSAPTSGLPMSDLRAAIRVAIEHPIPSGPA